MTLSEVPEGIKVFIRGYGKLNKAGNRHLIKFIEISGAVRTTEIEVVSNTKGFPMVIKTNGNKVAISREISDYLEVGFGRNKK